MVLASGIHPIHKGKGLSLGFCAGIRCNNCQNVGATSGDFIQLTCVFKDELDIGHINCVEVWYKLKGSKSLPLFLSLSLSLSLSLLLHVM
jgi:hypothetical protein